MAGRSPISPPPSPVTPSVSGDRTRAVSPVVGVVVLVGLAVVLAAGVGATALSITAEPPGDRAAMIATADAGTNAVSLEHAGGDTLDVRDLAVEIEIDGEPLDHQPPVPYFAARGFAGTPTGPFNQAADPRWSAGERATVEIASTNAPGMEEGDHVTVTVRTDRRVLARTEIRAA